MSLFTTALPTQASSNAVANSLVSNNSATAKASSSSGANSSSTSAAGDITSNDFLTLLVTEMQNQDPTQPTDPNAYIQQLVGVNSLQQLIAINQGLATVEGSAAPSSSTQAISSVANNL